MKLVKISSMACMSCIVVNNVLEKILQNYQLEIINYDYDFDEISYEVGNILPILIFIDENGNEISRLVGEVTYQEIENEIKRLG